MMLSLVEEFIWPWLPVFLPCLIVAYTLAYHFRWLDKGLPDGPKGYPIVGNLLQVDHTNPTQTFLKWRNQYGPVYRTYMGAQLMIVLADYKSIKEAFTGKTGELLLGRPDSYVLNAATNGRHGIANIDGDEWKEQRRFSATVLKDLGVGKPFMEAKINEQIRTLCKELDKQIQISTTSPIDIVAFVKRCVANVISSIAIGVTADYNDPEFEDYINRVYETMHYIGVAQPLQYFPFLRYLIPGGLGIDKIEANAKVIYASFPKKMIDQHWLEIKNQSEVKDFTHAYLQQMQKTEGSEGRSWFSEAQLQSVIGDLFMGGQDTTTTTISWALLLLSLHPDVQQKFYDEILQVCDGEPTWDDRAKLTYVNAVLTEIQRVGSISPFGLLHSATEDLHFRGYRIPKGTIVMPSLWSVHRDPQMFPDPEKFIPERFINPDTQQLQVEGMMPFSAGKRVCLGESLARMELFVMTTQLVSRYQLSTPPDEPPPTLNPVYGLTMAPEPFKLILRKRIV